ncbi:MAG: WD40/YVTN/BNR-like repeat-containing protein, partial [Candidatus Kapaibacteriota bacterium]
RVPDSLQQDVEITRIEFSQRDPRVGYAVVTYLFALNKNNGGLHRTTDGGYNWEIIGFPDTSIWALSVKSRGDKDEIFIGGYTEDFYTLDTNLVPGVGIVRISTDGGESWLNFDDKIDWVIYDLGSNSDLFAIQAIGDTIFSAGDYGTFRISTNGGFTFSYQNIDTYDDIRGLYFFGRRNGFVCGKNSTLLRTSNGGFTWNRVSIPTNNDLMGILFVDSLKGFIVGYKSTLLKTTNGGNEWIDLSIDYACDFLGIKRIGNQLVIYGSNGTVLVSSDFGETWTKLPIDFAETITGIDILNEEVFFLCTSSGNLYKYVNNLPTEKIVSDASLKFNSLKFVDDSVGFIVTNGPYYYRTEDNG